MPSPEPGQLWAPPLRVSLLSFVFNFLSLPSGELAWSGAASVAYFLLSDIMDKVLVRTIFWKSFLLIIASPAVNELPLRFLLTFDGFTSPRPDALSLADRAATGASGASSCWRCRCPRGCCPSPLASTCVCLWDSLKTNAVSAFLACSWLILSWNLFVLCEL